MRFRLLEAPALSAKSWKDRPKSALGSASRSSKPSTQQVPQDTDRDNTFVPTTPDEWEQVLYDSSIDRAVREIACVKWLEKNRPSSPLLSLLGGIRSKLNVFDAKVNDAYDKVDVEADSHTLTDPNDGEVKQDKVGGATNVAVLQRELDNLKKQTEAVRNQLQFIFKAIFIAIDCKSDLFESVITKLDLNRIPKTYYSNLTALANIVAEDDTFDTSKKYLFDTSLYNRLGADFAYTVKVFAIVNDSSKLASYYDPKLVDIKDLYDGSGIKPAGINVKDPEDFGTIYGVLESWKESASNENTAPKTATKQGKGKFEYSSFEEAEKAGMNKEGSIITVNGKFKFKDNEWKSVDK
jgi:hypothetical protein